MSSHLKGPSEGDWSVFAEKVVAERDALQAKLDKIWHLLTNAGISHGHSPEGLEKGLYAIEQMQQELASRYDAKQELQNMESEVTRLTQVNTALRNHRDEVDAEVRYWIRRWLELSDKWDRK